MIIFLIPIFVLLVLNIGLNKYGKKFYWFFELSHFLMGFLVAGFLASFLPIKGIYIVGGVLFVGLMWELWEFTGAYLPSVNNFMRKLNYPMEKTTLKDTCLDLILDTCGAVMFVLLS